MQALHTQTEAPQRVEVQFPSDDVLRVEGNKWRQYGIARRKELLEKDQERGGTIFKLKASCSVHRYTQVAHRVSPSVRSHPIPVHRFQSLISLVTCLLRRCNNSTKCTHREVTVRRRTLWAIV